MEKITWTFIYHFRHHLMVLSAQKVKQLTNASYSFKIWNRSILFRHAIKHSLFLVNSLMKYETIQALKLFLFLFPIFYLIKFTQREQCRSTQWSKMYLCATVIWKDILCISNSICKMRYKTGFEWSILRKYGMLDKFFYSRFLMYAIRRSYMVSFHWLSKWGRFSLSTRLIDRYLC